MNFSLDEVGTPIKKHHATSCNPGAVAKKGTVDHIHLGVHRWSTG